MHYWHLFLDYTSIFLEILWVCVIFGGIVWSIVFAIYQYFHHKNPKHIYKAMRQEIAYAILLGLEILIAVDILKSMDANIDLNRIISLGLIVLIRTVLSVSLEWEIHGKFPWQKEKENKGEH